jgi:NADP-dependent 3-hydroxy acid dehydrogenase YdfG
MTDFPYQRAMIVGAGSGISASLTSCLASLGIGVGLAARNVPKLNRLVEETGAIAFAADPADAASISKLFDDCSERTEFGARGWRIRCTTPGSTAP